MPKTKTSFKKGHLGYWKNKIGPMKNRQHSEETKGKISESRKGKIAWNKGLTKETSESVKKQAKQMEGKNNPSVKYGSPTKGIKLGHLTEEHKKLLSQKLKGKNIGEKNGMYNRIPWNKGITTEISFKWKEAINKMRLKQIGKKASQKTKEKMRLSAIKNVEKKKLNGEPLKPNIGKNETKLLNIIEKKKGIKLIRQYPISGYFVDGYDKINNVIYEVDEPFHKKQKQKEKDIERENYIKSILNCEFVRIQDGGN